MIHRLFQSKFKNHFVVVSMAMFNCSSCSNACDFYERTVTAGCLLLALAMLNVVSPSTNCSKYFIALHCSQSFGPTGYAPARICPPPTPPFGFANQSAYEATLLTATNYYLIMIDASNATTTTHEHEHTQHRPTSFYNLQSTIYSQYLSI